MPTINQLRTERLAYFRELKSRLRPVDTLVQKAERRIERVLERKRDIPSAEDFNAVLQTMFEAMEAIDQFLGVSESGGALFPEGSGATRSF